MEDKLKIFKVEYISQQPLIGYLNFSLREKPKSMRLDMKTSSDGTGLIFQRKIFPQHHLP